MAAISASVLLIVGFTAVIAAAVVVAISQGVLNIQSPIELPPVAVMKRRVRARIEQGVRYVVVTVLGGALLSYWVMGLLLVFGLDVLIPFEIPVEYRPYVQLAWIAESVLFFPVLGVTRWVMGKLPYIYIHAVDPELGNFGIHRISPRKFRRMTTINYQGKDEKPHSVETDSGSRAYEVDSYDPKTNVAITSDYAGLSPRDIRKDRSRLGLIQTKYLEWANTGVEAEMEAPLLAAKAQWATTSELVRRHEKAALAVGDTPKGIWTKFIRGQYGESEMRSRMSEFSETMNEGELAERFEDAAENAPEEGEYDE